MTDEVTPFRRPGQAPPPPGELSRARALAAEQADAQRERYGTAISRQRAERLIATGKVVPARITMALDIRDLEGPEVDIACGGSEPDVDMWELGLAVPSPEQVVLLAELTGFQPAFFYNPIDPGPLLGSPIFMCSGRTCTVTAPDVVDENGVLLYEGKPRQLPAAALRQLRNRPPAGQGALF
jgi:hypothetical protein